MGKIKRVSYVFAGVLTILLGILLILYPEAGLAVITLILAITMIGYGIRLLAHYSSLARHMVGGKYILYLGFAVLDLGVLTLTMSDDRTIPVFIYMFILFVFSGVIDVIKAFEEKRNKVSFWFFRLAFGLTAVTLGILSVISCFVYKSTEGMTIIFCFSLFYSGVVRIIKAFRKTSVVYIQ